MILEITEQTIKDDLENLKMSKKWLYATASQIRRSAHYTQYCDDLVKILMDERASITRKSIVSMMLGALGVKNKVNLLIETMIKNDNPQLFHAIVNTLVEIGEIAGKELITYITNCNVTLNIELLKALQSIMYSSRTCVEFKLLCYSIAKELMETPSKLSSNESIYLCVANIIGYFGSDISDLNPPGSFEAGFQEKLKLSFFNQTIKLDQRTLSPNEKEPVINILTDIFCISESLSGNIIRDIAAQDLTFQEFYALFQEINSEYYPMETTLKADSLSEIMNRIKKNRHRFEKDELTSEDINKFLKLILDVLKIEFDFPIDISMSPEQIIMWKKWTFNAWMRIKNQKKISNIYKINASQMMGMINAKRRTVFSQLIKVEN